MEPLDPRSFLLASALIHIAMPFAVWVLLRPRHLQANVDLWSVSGLCFLASFALFGGRGQIPDWASIYLAQACGMSAAALKIGVLRMEMPQAPRWPALAGAVLGAMVLILLAQAAGVAVRQGTAQVAIGAFALAVAVVAWRLGKLRRSRSARFMAVLWLAAGSAMLLRGVGYLLGLESGSPLDPGRPVLLSAALALLASVGANVGYLGLVLDQAQERSRQQQLAVDRMRDEQLAQALAAQTRAAVASERTRTTQLLAHEVRQPLHNAAVALQSAIGTLGSSHKPADAARAIEQAQAVLRRVGATLDNSVAAAALLTGAGRISTVDSDLQMLVDLSLGDLAPEERPRVHLDYRADARSARLEPTLLRLALRNLLANALLYAPGPDPVSLRVLDSDEPLGLVFEVLDQGPGIPEELRGRIFDEGVRASPPTVPGYGLGLHVVRRVAQLHGGRIEWLPNLPRGSIFRLSLPQGDPG